MNKLILASVLLLAVSASQGRVAWYGEEEFEDSIASLKSEGYTITYITEIDEDILAVHDVLVVCLTKVSPSQKDVILRFVEEGGGLLIIYDIASYPQVEDILSVYNLEKAPDTENPVFLSLLSDELIKEIKKRVAFSEKGKGRIISIGYDPVTAQALTMFRGEEAIFVMGLEWLCQDWHVEQVQNIIMKNRMKTVIPIVIVIALLAFIGFYFFKRSKPTKRPGLTDKEEKIRELKARFVYGELSKKEYQQELERLER
ncbi:MAG: hypothetical protein PVF58_08995 [Candidatus Methanofastidiosia archaeon]|jgi:hypothetical protein